MNTILKYMLYAFITFVILYALLQIYLCATKAIMSKISDDIDDNTTNSEAFKELRQIIKKTEFVPRKLPPPKTEPIKTEPIKTEPVKTEPESISPKTEKMHNKLLTVEELKEEDITHTSVECDDELIESEFEPENNTNKKSSIGSYFESFGHIKED